MMRLPKRPRGAVSEAHSLRSKQMCSRSGGLVMKIILLAGLLLLPPVAASAQNLVPPEIVQLENVQVDGDMKSVYVGNSTNHYFLYCSIKAAGCITPQENKNYLLFNKDTNWKMPGAKTFINLAFVQDWTVKYNEGENIGLVP